MKSTATWHDKLRALGSSLARLPHELEFPLKIFINDEEREVTPAITLAALLRELDLERSSVAIEVNAVLVPRARFDDHLLQPKDRLEIVTFVGGG